MEPRLHYGTITEAIQQLRERGYTQDFNLEENCIVCGAQKFNPDEFEISDVYRYEGNSDPDDEAAVYAIESKLGLKGILVTSYGVYADEMSAELLEKLRWPKK